MCRTSKIAFAWLVFTGCLCWLDGFNQGLPETLGTQVGQFLSRPFYAAFLGLAALSILFGPLKPSETRWMRVVLLAFIVAIGIGTEGILKSLFWEPRPGWNNVPGLHSGFPSGHALMSFAFSTTLAELFSSLEIWIFLAGVLVSYSRVEVTAHYPHQAVAGAFLGILIACSVTRAQEKWRQRRMAREKTPCAI